MVGRATVTNPVDIILLVPMRVLVAIGVGIAIVVGIGVMFGGRDP